VLRGEQSVLLREATAHAAPKKARRASAPPAAAANLGQEAQVRFINLKAWRAEVAREHNLPAYVIFHDATLAAIAERCPATLDDLQGISGMGEEARSLRRRRAARGAGAAVTLPAFTMAAGMRHLQASTRRTPRHCGCPG
jgi:ATP-dependent DNA helicase RecQ